MHVYFYIFKLASLDIAKYFDVFLSILKYQEFLKIK